jgi:Ca2+-binding RTX toxin-like protein
MFSRTSQPSRRPGALSEPLEARRLLTVTLEAAGVLSVVTDSDNDIIQFESQGNADGPTGFRVIESVGVGTPAGTTDADYDAYIDNAVAVVTSRFFSLDEVRLVRIDSGAGNDLIIGGNKLAVPLEIDTAAGDDTVSGGPRADTVLGNNGDDSIFGGGGNDLMTGNEGADTLWGGDGFDRVDYRNSTSDVSVVLDNLANDGEAGENDYVDVEGVVGGLGNDTIDATGAAFAVEFSGGPGDDAITGGLLDDTLIGGSGVDSLIGGGGNDLYLAIDDEVDTIDAAAGEFADQVDRIFGDVGGESQTLGTGDFLFNDFGSISTDTTQNLGGIASFDADTGTLTINGTAGDDQILVEAGAAGQLVFTLQPLSDDADDTPTELIFADRSQLNLIYVLGDAGDDLIFAGGLTIPVALDGGIGNDTLVGSGGDDVLAGNFGDDLLVGGDGDDRLGGGFGADYVSGGDGLNDQVSYADRTLPVRIGLGVLADDGYPEEGDDIFTDVEVGIGGSAGDDLNTTGNLPVRFFGNAGNDTLLGGSADDVFEGGAGRDLMTGLAGNDQFFSFDGEADTLDGGLGTDTATADLGSLDTFISIENR